MTKIKILSLITASTILMSGCSSINDNSYWGYQKNERKYGAITKQFDNAIVNGNIEWLEEILADNPDFDVNYCGNIMREYGQSGNYQHETLRIINSYGMLSAEKRNKALDFLLNNGLNPDLEYSNGNYALEECCGTLLAETLIKHNADININDGSIIIKIIYDMYTYPIDLFIDKGAIINAGLFEQVYADEMPLNPRAFQSAYKYFIENGNNTSFSKAEEYAILGENEKLIEALSSDEFDTNQLKVISYFAYCFGNQAVIDILCDKYSEGDLSIPSIYVIANIGNFDAFKYLYNKGELGTYTPEFLFYTAVRENHTEIIDFLIDKNVDIEKRILSATYECGDINTVRRVSEYMLNKNMLTEHTFYNLDVSMTMNDFTKDYIDYFMTEHNFSLQQLSLKSTDFLTSEYLFNNGRPLSVTDLENALYKNDVDMVNMLFQYGADANQPKFEKYYNTIYSSEENDFSKLLVKYNDIISHTNDFITINNDDDNCWYNAIVYGNSETIQIMIDNGLNLDNEKLLYYAIRYGSSAVFNVLYEADASIDYISDIRQETLLDVAKTMGRDDIIKILKDAGVKAYKAL